MYISVTQIDDRANYLICASGKLRIILLCEDMALFQFSSLCISWIQKEK